MPRNSARLESKGTRKSKLGRPASWSATCAPTIWCLWPGWPLSGGTGRSNVLRRCGQTQDEPAPRGQQTRAASDEWAIRVVAGFNIMILSALVGVGAARAIASLFPARPWADAAGWGGIAVGVGVFFLMRFILTTAGPLVAPPKLHGVVWVLVGVGALFASVALGALLLTGVGISTAGRRSRGSLSRTMRPSLLTHRCLRCCWGSRRFWVWPTVRRRR